MRARLVLLAVVVVGAIGLWWLRPRAEGLLTVAEAQKKVDFPVGVPQTLPAGTETEGVKVLVPVRRPTTPPTKPGSKVHKGFGMALDRKGKAIFIGFVLNNSPAQKAGVEAGDQIVSINERALSSLSFKEVLKMLREHDTATLEVKHAGKQRTLRLQQEEYDSGIPPPSEPVVVFLYEVKGRKFTLKERRLKPGTVIHWAGTVLRKVNLNGVEATLRNIGGHLTLTWVKGNVLYELNNYQDGVLADDLIKVARSIKIDEGGKRP